MFRLVRPFDRFLQHLEVGDFEVADDKLYEAVRRMSVQPQLSQLPPAEFLNELVIRLERAGKNFIRREKVTGYPLQMRIND